jgi:hypothetical protein
MITTKELLLKIIQKFCAISTNKNVDLETLLLLFNELKDEYKIEVYNNQKKEGKIEVSNSMIRDINDLVNSGHIKRGKLGTSQKVMDYPENESYVITISGALTCILAEIPHNSYGSIQKVLEKYIK